MAPPRKIDPDRLLRIVADRPGLSLAALGRETGISTSRVYQILTRAGWRWVSEWRGPVITPDGATWTTRTR